MTAKPSTSSSSALVVQSNKPSLASPSSVVCYNPNCRSPGHLARDCPKPFPADWNHDRSRGRSRERKSSQRDSSRGSRGASVSSRGSRGVSRDSRTSSRDPKHRTPTPGPSSSRPRQDKSVAFKQAYHVSSDVNDAQSDAESDVSAYDPSAAHAFLVAPVVENVASKD